jgi:hypothetical protein
MNTRRIMNRIITPAGFRAIAWFCLGLSALILATNFILSGYWRWVIPIPVLLILWGFGQHRGWMWTNDLIFAGMTVLTTAGFWLSTPTTWLLVSLVAALSAWDLEHYTWRTRDVKSTQGVIEQGKGHFKRLLLVDGIAILLALLAQSLHFKLGFGLAIFFSLLVVLALSQGVIRNRKDSS